MGLDMGRNRRTDTGLEWESSFRTHTGPVRAINEDACLDAGDVKLWAVADGMGGHEAGQAASTMIVEALTALTTAKPAAPRADAVDGALQAVNQSLREISKRQFDGRIIGSTVVALVGEDCTATCLWAGDSRLYRLRGGILRQITHDHSHVQELVRQGVMAPEQARHHRLGNIITRAVGADAELTLDRVDLQVDAGDLYLLCSDGLNKVVEDSEIARILGDGSCEEIADALIHLCLVRNVGDNVTVGVIRAFRPPRD